ncbi:MAG: 16S rRNA (guanine(966)-N(2))-methyltransferase RsmD [Sulfurifustaceae bacterium]
MAPRTKRRPARDGAGSAGSAYPGSIRIIGGQWRSRRLPVLTAEGLRPTPDRVRETLFNWLAPYIEGADCLDLFSGTGALCLEALSRGAAHVVMVERQPIAAAQLRANLARLGATGAQVVAGDALEYLAGPARPFDVVFLDPPFAAAPEMIRACGSRIARRWIKPGGLVYIEAPRALKELPVPADWEPLKRNTAGQVAFSLWRLPAGG